MPSNNPPPIVLNFRLFLVVHSHTHFPSPIPVNAGQHPGFHGAAPTARVHVGGVEQAGAHRANEQRPAAVRQRRLDGAARSGVGGPGHRRV